VYNLQGDVIGIINGGHGQRVFYEYDTWRKRLSLNGGSRDDIGIYNPFLYRHYQYDVETGLYYLNSRYYSPELGRFISTDTVLGRPGKLNGHNLYSYCRSNPLNSYDPSGYDEETFNDLNNIINLSDEYIEFLETVYFYSLSMQDKSELNTSTPEVYTTAKVLSNCEAFAEKKYSYERYDCAYSIAMQLLRRTTHTGITTIMANDAIASVSLEAAGGFANLLEGMMLIVYDSSYTKPGRHGGIYVNQSTVYESSPGLKGFRKSTPARQKWNKVVWLDGMILSPKQMEIVGMIVFMVRE